MKTNDKDQHPHLPGDTNADKRTDWGTSKSNRMRDLRLMMDRDINGQKQIQPHVSKVQPHKNDISRISWRPRDPMVQSYKHL